MARRRRTFTDQIRQAVEECGTSRYAIWKATGLGQDCLCKFVGGAGISIAHLDVLADFLGLNVTVDGPKPSKQTRKPAARKTQGRR